MNGMQTFFADARVSLLAERIKIADDILDIVELHENQHSDVLKWCLDPREGHDQGDEILKDLLMAAYQASMDNIISGESATFLKKWTPAKIKTASFGSAFILREHPIAEGRLDLIVVDVSNKILIVIENKTGSKQGNNQLEKYQNGINTIKKKSYFEDFSCVYIFLDRYLGKLPNANWIPVDYTWLESGAARARLAIERGNTAAKLLQAYCEHLTGWLSPEDEEIDSLVNEIALEYGEFIKELKNFSSFNVLDPMKSKNNKIEDEMLGIFYLQHRDLCNKLTNKTKINLIKDQVEIALGLGKNEYDIKKIKFYICPRDASDIGVQGDDEGGNDYWPINICVSLLEGNGSNQFSVALRIHQKSIDPKKMDILKPELEKNFGKKIGKSEWTLLETKPELDTKEMISYVKEMDKKVSEIIHKINLSPN